MSAAELTPRPLRVSPLIKFSRWSLLTLGIVYGALHQKRFSRKENALREQEAREKPARDAQLALERQKALEAELKMLAESGIK